MLPEPVVEQLEELAQAADEALATVAAHIAAQASLSVTSLTPIRGSLCL
jgi:hypothetical protein